jgi:hypothetical protein
MQGEQLDVVVIGKCECALTLVVVVFVLACVNP